MRILITGMEGFVGSHLAEYALAKGAEVHGTIFPGAARTNLAGLRGIKTHPLDIREASGTSRLIRRLSPERIFHLAGQSNVFASTEMAEQTLSVNILGNLNILEAGRAAGQAPKVLVVGSANEYGRVRSRDLPIKESQPLNPGNPYAVSKVCQDIMGEYYHKTFKLHIIRVRPFNHIGPRQSPAFVCAAFARQIAEIEIGRQEPVIQVGHLEVRRDFTDVRDIVKAYWLALQKGRAGEVYNLGSGRAIMVKSLLNGLLVYSEKKIKIHRMPGRVRKGENSAFYGDYSKFRRHTGWQPGIPLEQTLRDTLTYWRKKIITAKR